ncbi:MAG TPA: hypothetical protein VK625_22920, partial [Flavitalea sp.]|nr:hypothetical protein [Flavitalea sp.]
LGLVAMAGLLFFWYGFMLIVDGGQRIFENMQVMTYFFGLALTGCFYGSILFAELSSGPKAMNYLIFPASHLEKLVCGLLYGVVLFFIAYTLVFYIVDIPMVMLGNSLHKSNFPGEAVSKSSEIANVFWRTFSDERPTTDSNPHVLFILMYFAVQSAYILGSVYFPKFSFIKTTISLLLVALLISLYVAKILQPMLPDGGHYVSLTSFRIFENNDFNQQKIVSLPGWTNNTLTFLLKFAFAPIFWVVTYFRFKEKEV